uniref:Putative secreted protein n=1 Tax=Ixodes ricinus TaxID=34613 RepID=A0A6B0UPT1_IXORI
MLRLVLLDVVLVALLEVLGQHHIPVLTYCVHAGLLADGVDVGARDLVWPGDVVLEVELVAQVHLARDGGEDEALLAPVRHWELYLAVQASRAQQGGVQRVRSVGGHYHLDIRGLVKAIHLVEQL